MLLECDFKKITVNFFFLIFSDEITRLVDFG